MKTFRYLVLFVFATVSFLYGDSNTFQKRMEQFRYGLNKDLAAFSYYEISNMQLPVQTDKKIGNWIKENQKDIVKYKVELLKKNQIKKISIDGHLYEKVPFDDIGEFAKFSEFVSSGVSANVYSLMTINPYWHISMVSTVFVSRVMGAEALGKRTLLGNLAGYLISTEKTGKNTWTILLDQYDFLFVMSLNVETGEAGLSEVYHLKLLTDD